MWGIDAYERTARLIPALLVLAPVTAVSWGLWGPWHISTPLLLISLLVLSVPFAEWARLRGRKKQRTLWAKCGGSPLATTLAKSTDGWSEEFRQRALSRLNRLYPDETPVGGDPEDYELVATLAAAYARETGSQTVFPENVSYGFARNSYGLRLLGIATASGCILLLATAVVTDLYSTNAKLVAALAVSVAILSWWLFEVNEKKAHDAGDRYAQAVIRWLASEPTDLSK